MTRRQMMINGAASAALLAVASVTVLSVPAESGEPVFVDDNILGDVDAPITIIEYSSLTCPHCAQFHKDTLPEVKENWIDTGKARIVYRHFPLDGLALRAAMVANCIEGERYFTFLDALFHGQKLWAQASDPVQALSQVAALAGLNGERFEACISDEEEANAILERRKHGEATYDIGSTPTFIINGRKVSGALDYEAFSKILEEAEGQS
ncbi:MAG: DsbA family protein [Kiloniellales bacterium]|jgi:protein-disulfide isomerase|nr:DsbA family protein [Kiloniellales bacterium]